MAQWRRYPSPNARRKRQLNDDAAQSLAAQWSLWQSISTPIPNRGDATTCANRRHNLALAIRSLHQQLIPPGGAFSLSQQLGEPSEAAGYRSGPVFVKGQVLQDSGGGPLPDCHQSLSVIPTRRLPHPRAPQPQH